MAMKRFCPVDSVIDLIGHKGALQIIRLLFGGPKRTTEILRWLELSSKTLSDRLKELEKSGIILRRSFPESPPRVEYSLTQRGEELWPVLEAMRQVGQLWQLNECRTVELTIVREVCHSCTLYHKTAATPLRQPPASMKPAPERRKPDVTLL